MRRFPNRIRFNCAYFHQMFSSQPRHCYNCLARNGYPQNLGGDEDCVNFKRVSAKKKRNVSPSHKEDVR